MDCYTFTTNDNSMDWNDDGDNSSMEVLDLIAIPYEPEIMYQHLNSTHYQWCGHLLYFAEYFAKFTLTR